jgi:hypothetical protein
VDVTDQAEGCAGLCVLIRAGAEGGLREVARLDMAELGMAVGLNLGVTPQAVGPLTLSSVALPRAPRPDEVARALSDAGFRVTDVEPLRYLDDLSLAVLVTAAASVKALKAYTETLLDAVRG